MSLGRWLVAVLQIRIMQPHIKCHLLKVTLKLLSNWHFTEIYQRAFANFQKMSEWGHEGLQQENVKQIPSELVGMSMTFQTQREDGQRRGHLRETTRSRGFVFLQQDLSVISCFLMLYPDLLLWTRLTWTVWNLWNVQTWFMEFMSEKRSRLYLFPSLLIPYVLLVVWNISI